MQTADPHPWLLSRMRRWITLATGWKGRSRSLWWLILIACYHSPMRRWITLAEAGKADLLIHDPIGFR